MADWDAAEEHGYQYLTANPGHGFTIATDLFTWKDQAISFLRRCWTGFQLSADTWHGTCSELRCLCSEIRKFLSVALAVLINSGNSESAVLNENLVLNAC